jgi:PsbP
VNSAARTKITMRHICLSNRNSIPIFISIVASSLFVIFINNIPLRDASAQAFLSRDISSATDNIRGINTGNFATYENSTFGVRFKYPSNWQKTELLSPGITLIQFISPHNVASPARIEVIIERMPNQMTLNQYLTRSNDLLSLTVDVTNIISSNNSTTLSGNPAYTRTFMVKQPLPGTLQEIELEMLQTISIRGDEGYTITYSAETPQFERYLMMAQQMIDSFTIL